MRDIEQLKEEILKDYPRMAEDSTFSFSCYPGVPCFNHCCHDVNIFLTPYDIVRLKNNLGLTSEQFLARYTISPFDKNLKYPVLLLQMEDSNKKPCPFVGDSGCGVYEDRPWACRMYPLGMASSQDGAGGEEDFYFLLKEDTCKGHCESHTQTVAEWVNGQSIEDYNKMGYYFKELTLHKTFLDGTDLTPEKMEMFFLANYNVDTFRKFLFNSTFFEKFEVDENTRDKIKDDDTELLKFGYTWLRFALFGEKTMTVKSETLEAKQKELDKKAGK